MDCLRKSCVQPNIKTLTRTLNGTATKHEHTFKHEITITSILLLYNCYTMNVFFYYNSVVYTVVKPFFDNAIEQL